MIYQWPSQSQRDIHPYIFIMSNQSNVWQIDRHFLRHSYYNIDMAGAPKQKHTEDEIKHVEFLYSDLQDFRDIQDKHYNSLITKVTFLCGFVVTVLTLYGTYATQVNNYLKIITLSILGIALLILCGTLKNRNFYQAAMSDIDVDSSDYFNKVYQAVSNIKKACDDNEKPLKEMAVYIRWGVRVLVLGIVFLVLSFCFSNSSVVQSKQHAEHSYRTTQTKKTDKTRENFINHKL